jgi:hypothetical protein
VFEVLALWCSSSSNKKKFDGFEISKLDKFAKFDIGNWC